jgi:hypothetical protein
MGVLSMRQAVNRRSWVVAAAAVFSAGVVGCGTADTPPVVRVHEVKGKVLLRNGKPLPSGHVYFVPTQEPLLLATGTVAPDGSFSLTTGDSGAGAPEGEYKVRVEPDGPPPPPASAAVTGSRGKKGAAVPRKYLDEDSSGLRVTVHPGPNKLDAFVLK